MTAEGRPRHARRAALATVIAAATALIAAPSSADLWSDHLEIHGRLSSRTYLRTPGLDAGDDLHLSSLRTELLLDTRLRLVETSDARVEIMTTVRPSYDAVYDAYPSVWGPSAREGALGTSAPAFQRAALDGRRFPGHGACVKGEFCLVNQDLGTLIDGRTRPGIALSSVQVAGGSVGPWAARGSRQPKLGGPATAAVFSQAATGLTGAPGAAELAASLAKAGTEVPGSAPAGLGTPLNAYAGALGDRGSFEQLPADINRTENELQFRCFDNSRPHCWLDELFAEFEYRDTFLRLGRQRIVWGKTDAFQLQDVINPLDQGIHNIFPSLDERRIPVWAARLIQSVGEVGPFEDVSVEAVWVVDRFRPTQIGQCGEPYAFTLACQLRANAALHQTLNISLAEVEQRPWTLGSSEPGARVELYLPDAALTLSFSAFWGFQDQPVFEAKNHYSTDNPNPAALLLLQALGAGPMIDDLSGATGERPWVTGFDPYAHDDEGRPAGTLAEANEDLLRVWDDFIAPSLRAAPDPLSGWIELEKQLEAAFGFTQGALALPWSGSELVASYPRVLTLGASLDYEIPGVETILRLEFAYEIDRALTNTARADLRDDSDVFKLAVGLDRPSILPFFGGRKVYLSAQLFWEHIIDYDDGRGHDDGMIAPANGLISTLYLRTGWRDDSLLFTGFLAVDWAHQAWAIGPSLRWEVNERLALEAGLNILLGRRQRHSFRDICPGGGFDCLDDPRAWNPGQMQGLNRALERTTEAPFWAESFADRYMQRRDEIWFGFSWDF